MPGLHLRTPDSLQRTLALTFASFLLYFPANMLPILKVESITGAQANTIVGGVIQFWQTGDYPVAIIIFTASVMIPVLKILALGWLCYAAKIGHHPHGMTRLYRVTELVGRWSMVDVFVVAILVAVVQLGSRDFDPSRAGRSFVCVGRDPHHARGDQFRSAPDLGCRRREPQPNE